MGRAGCCRRGAERLASPSAARRFRPLALLIVALCCVANIGNTTHNTTHHSVAVCHSPHNTNRSFCLKVQTSAVTLHVFYCALSCKTVSCYTSRLCICAAGSLCCGPHCCCCCCLTMALRPAAVQQPEPGSSFSSSLMGRQSPGCPPNGSWRRMRRRGGEEET